MEVFIHWYCFFRDVVRRFLFEMYCRAFSRVEIIFVPCLYHCYLSEQTYPSKTLKYGPFGHILSSRCSNELVFCRVSGSKLDRKHDLDYTTGIFSKCDICALSKSRQQKYHQQANIKVVETN